MKNSIKCFLTLTSFTCMVSCSKNDPIEELDGVYVPLFTNFWQIEKGPAGDGIVLTAVVSSIDSSKGTGLLTGSHLKGGESYNMKGSFHNLSVEMWYLSNAENGSDNGPYQGRKYKGRYDTLSIVARIRMANVLNNTDSMVIRLN
ncbi:MAG: hypothetical protein DI535_08110 [Citrobacter freundii]|nr:MAG: hypothetical protein DI535_08110 [Citrobacter freundii]